MSPLLTPELSAKLAADRLSSGETKYDSDTDYPSGDASDRNEVVTELIRPSEAWIVRCGFGSDVLVTRGASALTMIDYDGTFVTPKKPLDFFGGELELWELDLQMRVYKTAHGYRGLVENRSYKPGYPIYNILSDCMCNDPLYGRICEAEGGYRARLTPKPLAPFNARTCQYLGTVGSARIDEYLAPLIQLHDERTGALLESGELY